MGAHESVHDEVRNNVPAKYESRQEPPYIIRVKQQLVQITNISSPKMPR